MDIDETNVTKVDNIVLPQANPPGEPNPNCPAEPNMPWFLITGGVGRMQYFTILYLCTYLISTCPGIGVLLLLRIAINLVTSRLSQRLRCCHQQAGCLCEFSCNLLYDVIAMVGVYTIYYLHTIYFIYSRYIIYSLVL